MKRASVLTYLPAVLVMAWALTLSAQEQANRVKAVPQIKAHRINPRPPIIDGNLDDSVWQNESIEFARNFTQTYPDEGKMPAESTLAAVAYDEDAIYVAFCCYDSQPDKIHGQLVRRDRSSESDRVTFRVDPFHDHQNGNAFEISAAGVLRDCRYYNENNSDMSWDAVWEGNVKRQSWGWTAEMRIPYHCLRFPEKSEHTWGVNFSRYVNHDNQSSVWVFTPTSEAGFVSKFGHLTDLIGIKSSSHFELMPYAVSSAETEPKNLGNPDGRDYMANAGFDLKYAFLSNFVLDATINPDFGQVELDQPVLNLSTYETYFSEKRPFFMEGSELYNTDFTLFYSRRIGRQPWRDVTDPEAAYYTEYPDATTILGAAKLTGKFASGTSIAFLNAVTAKEKAEYAVLTNWGPDTTWTDGSMHIDTIPRDTISRRGVVEPQANYSVLRLKQDVLRNSHVGLMMTLASQQEAYPATTGGVDWRLSTNNGIWQTRGQIVASRVDNQHTGFGFNGTIEKAAGKHILGNIGVYISDPNLRLNRLGYLGRNNERQIWSWMQYQTTDDWWIIRNTYSNINFYSSWNYDNLNISLGGNINTSITFTNSWSFGAGTSIQAERYSDVETRGNGPWIWPVYPTYMSWVDINSDPRKAIALDFGGSFGTDRGGDHFSYHFGVDYKPKSNLAFSFGPSFQRYMHAKRWVRNVRDESASKTRSVFGDLDWDILSLAASASYLMTRNLSVQLSAEGLVDGLNYRVYRYYLGNNQYSEPLQGYNEDYNYSALNSTLVLRWEYNPGSSLYLVWTRAHSEFDQSLNNLVFDRDLKRLVEGMGTNVFLIKISYWLNV